MLSLLHGFYLLIYLCYKSKDVVVIHHKYFVRLCLLRISSHSVLMLCFLKVDEDSKFDDFTNCDENGLSTGRELVKPTCEHLTKSSELSHQVLTNCDDSGLSVHQLQSLTYANKSHHLPDECVERLRSESGSDTTVDSAAHDSCSVSEEPDNNDDSDFPTSGCRNLRKQSSKSSIDELLFDLYDKHGGKCLTSHLTFWLHFISHNVILMSKLIF